MIYTPQQAKHFSGLAGRKWRPSNGTEGELFIEYSCSDCDNFHDGECDYLVRSMYLGVHDSDYPTELQYGHDGQPTCTARTIGGVGQGYRCDQTDDLFEVKND